MKLEDLEYRGIYYTTSNNGIIFQVLDQFVDKINNTYSIY